MGRHSAPLTVGDMCMKKRIWELDALRGLCILGMVIVHFVYDLNILYGIVHWNIPTWFSLVQTWGGVLFLLISGISATLGSRSVRRGLIVLGCGMVISAVTYGMYRLGMANLGIIIYFGVLQCLGLCMILWWLFRRLPTWSLAAAGAAMVVAGLWLRGKTFDVSLWLMPLGITPNNFFTSDYFPLLPNLGFFLLGAVIGRTAYRNKQTLLPSVREKHPILAFLQLCGKQSLLIYMLHQPVLSGLCMLLDALFKGVSS